MSIFRRTRRETATSPRGNSRSRTRADILALLGLAVLSAAFFWRRILTNRAPIWGDILVYRALVADLALHTLMLSAFTYVFLRRLSLSGMSAFLGAVTFAFSGFVAVRVRQVSVIRTLAWLPLLLYVVAGFTSQRGIVRSSIPLAAVLAIMTLAGHMQTTLISGLLAIVLGLSRIGQFRGAEGAQGKSPLAAFAAAFALGSVLASALAAAQILPADELVWHYEGRDPLLHSGDIP